MGQWANKAKDPGAGCWFGKCSDTPMAQPEWVGGDRPGGSGWHKLCVHVDDKTNVQGSIDGVAVGSVDLGSEFHNTGSINYRVGMVALGSGWHSAYFDNLVIKGVMGDNGVPHKFFI